MRANSIYCSSSFGMFLSNLIIMNGNQQYFQNQYCYLTISFCPIQSPSILFIFSRIAISLMPDTDCQFCEGDCGKYYFAHCHFAYCWFSESYYVSSIPAKMFCNIGSRSTKSSSSSTSGTGTCPTPALLTSRLPSWTSKNR